MDEGKQTLLIYTTLSNSTISCYSYWRSSLKENDLSSTALYLKLLDPSGSWKLLLWFSLFLLFSNIQWRISDSTCDPICWTIFGWFWSFGVSFGSFSKKSYCYFQFFSVTSDKPSFWKRVLWRTLLPFSFDQIGKRGLLSWVIGTRQYLCLTVRIDILTKMLSDICVLLPSEPAGLVSREMGSAVELLGLLKGMGCFMPPFMMRLEPLSMWFLSGLSNFFGLFSE